MVRRALALAALLAGGCDQFTQVDRGPVEPLDRPLILMHRGAGANNPEIRENTMPAMLYGASLYDGVEMDLQLSRDGTLWLGHDNDVYDCSDPLGGATAGAVVGCFQELRDTAIDAVASCDVATAQPCTDPEGDGCVQHYVRLEEVFQRFSTDPALTQDLLALDVKDQLCGSLGLDESKTMADRIDALTRAHGMEWRLLVESDYVTFMRRFKDNGTPTYLFVEGYAEADPIIADADREGADGISYRYTSEPLDPSFPAGLRNRGLRVIIWPVPDPQAKVEDIAPAWGMAPDVILTDRSDFLDYLELSASVRSR
ncbi:MAG: glycerophosphodiester phosphodiesterase [Anaeromyxobacter sp.]